MTITNTNDCVSKADCNDTTEQKIGTIITVENDVLRFGKTTSLIILAHHADIIEDPDVAQYYNKGLDVADEAGIVQGVGEISGGVDLTGGSLLPAPVSGGSTLVTAGVGVDLQLMDYLLQAKVCRT